MANSSIKKNYIYNVVYQILLFFIPLITSPYISRVLGVNNVGIYSYTHSVAEYFILFAMLGVKNYGNRQISIVRDDIQRRSKAFFSIYTFQLLSSLIIMIIYYVYIGVFVQDNQLIAVIQGIYVLTAAVDISWFFFGMEEFKITVTRNIIIKIVSVICIFLFVKERDNLPLYTLILAVSIFAGYVSVFPFLKKYIIFEKLYLAQIKEHILPNLLLFIPVIAVSIFNIMDKIMLGRMSDYVQVGLYSNTEKVMRIPLGIITALGTVMMPRMSYLVAKGDRENSQKVIEQSMIFVMCVGCALAGGLAGIGEVFAPIFFGKEFADCGKLLMFLSPTVLSLSWANVIRTQFLIPNKMDAEFTISTIIGAVVNLVVNYLLIPIYGALGAIWGTLCAETALTIYQTYVVRKHLPIKHYLKETLFFVFLGIGMCVMVKVLGNILGEKMTTLLIQILMGGLIYVVISLIYINFFNMTGIRKFRSLIIGIFKKK